MNWKEYFKNLAIFILFTTIVLSLALGLVYESPSARNSRTDAVWNNGICKTCDQRFIPYGVNNGVKYYVCYGCGVEIVRY